MIDRASVGFSLSCGVPTEIPDVDFAFVPYWLEWNLMLYNSGKSPVASRLNVEGCARNPTSIFGGSL